MFIFFLGLPFKPIKGIDFLHQPSNLQFNLGIFSSFVGLEKSLKGDGIGVSTIEVKF